MATAYNNLYGTNITEMPTRADNNSDLLKEASNENFKLYLNHLDA